MCVSGRRCRASRGACSQCPRTRACRRAGKRSGWSLAEPLSGPLSHGTGDRFGPPRGGDGREIDMPQNRSCSRPLKFKVGRDAPCNVFSSLRSSVRSPFANAAAGEVPFVQAAIFFFLGLEPPHINIATETKPGIREKATTNPTGTVFLVLEDEPCKVQWLPSRGNSPKQEMILIDFSKIPSPRAMKITTNAFGVVKATYMMPPGARCSAWYDLSTDPPGKRVSKEDCWPGNSFTGNVYRRLKALDYIRNNFCPGLPEPPPPPPRPLA